MYFLKWRFLIIPLVIVLVAGAVHFILQLEFRYDIRSFFPKKNEDLQFYYDHCREFGSDERFLLAAFQAERSIFDSTFLSRLDSFTRFTARLPEVRTVQSLTNFQDYLSTPFGIVPTRPLKPERPETYALDSLNLLRDPRIAGWLVSKDARTAALIIETRDSLADREKEHLVDTLHIHALLTGMPAIHLGGQLNTEVNYIRMLIKESTKATLICFLIVVVLLIFLFRSVNGILTPAATVLIGLLLLYGFLGIQGRSMNILSTLFPTLMAVVGMSDLIHIFSKYLDELRAGLPKKEALRITMKEKGLSIFLTSLTTAIGFLSLTISSIRPVQQYGLDGAFGVLLAFLLAYFFTPSVLSLLPPPSVYRKKTFADRWNRFFEWHYQFVVRHTRSILWGFAALAAISLVGISLVSTNHVVTSFAAPDTKYSKDIRFFNEHFGGIRIFDMALLASLGRTINDPEVLAQVDKLHEYLSTRPELGAVFSPVTLYKSANKTFHGGRLEAYVLPQDPAVLQKYDRQLLKNLRDLYSRLISEDRRKGRLFANMPDMGMVDAGRLNEEIGAWIAANIDPQLLQVRFTGSALLLDQNTEQLIRSLFMSLSIAFVVICLIMAWLFRNWKMIFVAIIPNIFPLVMMGGILGFAGITLSSAVSLIFTLGFVIAVDDTIHFLNRFRWERQKGLSVDKAIHSTIPDCGKPIVTSSVVLAIGYTSIVFSDFSETFYHGLLMSITLMLALLADLFLLPALLRVFLVRKPVGKRNLQTAWQPQQLP